MFPVHCKPIHEYICYVMLVDNLAAVASANRVSIFQWLVTDVIRIYKKV
jgi:hypothetical protein